MPVLRPLYALAIALLVAAFVGFGISAFYPAPEYPISPQEWDEAGGPNPTEEEKKRMAELDEAQGAYQDRLSDYNRVVCVIAIGAAVLILVASILWISRFPVIGDGATLGAVFTLFYGLFGAFMTDDERFRFIAVTVGLAILVFLVYWKFSRPQQEKPA